MPALREVIDALEAWFDPRWAASWDAVGLVCGDPDEPVERMLLAVDPVPATVDEAIRTDAALLITHHPLLLTGVHGVPADDPKGGLVHRMIRAGVAHYVAHTNADAADPGVSDALAVSLGLHDLRPLDVVADAPLDKLVVFVPVSSAAGLIDSLAAAGAGRLGAYDRCAWTTVGEGTFRPRAGAHPTVGRVEEVETIAESRVEMVVPRALRASVLAALRQAHPYEEPAFDLIAMAELPSTRGIGRIGLLRESMTLAALTAHAAHTLPPTSWGVRAAGEPDQLITTVAVCGGAGGGLIAAAHAAGADAYLTADLKHHQVSERPAGLAVLDAAHWATELPFLHELAARLRQRFGTTVEVAVSGQVTDPWNLHAQPSESSTQLP